MVITDAWIAAIATRDGVGWTRHQLSLLGVPWPPPKGWRRRLVGTSLPDDVAAQACACTGHVSPKTLKMRAKAAAHRAAPSLESTAWTDWVERPDRFDGPGWYPARCTVCQRGPSTCRCTPEATYRPGV